jgi:hypothetical protein
MEMAIVYDAVYPWVKGGAEKRVWEISRRLARMCLGGENGDGA